MLSLTVVFHIYLRRYIMFNHKPDLLVLLSDLSHHEVPEMKKGKLLLNLFLSLILPFSRDYSYVYLQCSNQYIIFLYTDRRWGQSVRMSRVSLRPRWSDVPLRVKTRQNTLHFRSNKMLSAQINYVQGLNMEG